MNGHRQTANGSSLPFRPPTVDQALQHSPLTSIVPFSPETIPFPSASPPSSSAVFAHPDQRASARRVLDSLNSEATSQPGTSVRLQKTLRDLKQLLDASKLTEFNFKGAPPLPTPPPDSPSVPTASNGILKHSGEPNLSPFAKMVLNNTDIAHRYPTPDSPLGSSREHTSARKPPKASPATPHQQSVARNQGAVSLNAKLGLPGSNVSTPRKVPQVLVSGLSPSSQREDYESFAYLDEQDKPLSKKRKRPEADEEALTVTFNQQQKADKKTDELQNLLDDIFEAEDNYESEGPSSLSPDVAKYITVKEVGFVEAPVLTADAQRSLNTHLQPVLDAGRFNAISVDDVVRLQKLCKSRIDSIDTVSLDIDSGREDERLQDWLSGIQDVEHALGAAKILLKTMTAGRVEKKIYSEGMVGTVVNALKRTLGSMILIAESRPNSPIFDVSSNHKQVPNLLQRSGKILELLGELVATVQVAESAVTSTEDVATRLIFVENATSEKDSALGIKKFEVVRSVAMDVLAKIFARYEDRRASTLRDVLNSIGKLSVDRRSARQYKMADGKAIQLVSALLMRLVQTSATISIAQQTGKGTVVRSTRKNDVDEDGDDSSESSDGDAPRRKMPNKAANLSSQSLAKIARRFHDDAQMATDFVVKHLVDRAKETTKSADLPFRNLLDIFTEDFLSVLGCPEWPAAAIFLHKLTQYMANIIADKQKQYSVQAKTMALDILGIMGSGLIDLQVHLGKDAQKLDKRQSSLSGLLSQLGEQLSEQLLDQLSNQLSGNSSNLNTSVMMASKTELLDFEGPYRIVLEYLRHSTRSEEQRSAQGCHIQRWASDLCEMMASQDTDDEENPALVTLEQRLKHMILDPTWLAAEYDFESVSEDHGRVAAMIVALQTPFSRHLQHIVGYILHSMSNPGKIRSQSLKSLGMLMEKNPRILNDGILGNITISLTDAGAQVREYSLQLLDRCLRWNPAIEPNCTLQIISRTNDASPKIKKKAMEILKGIYLRNEAPSVKTSIADALLFKIQDTDEDVSKEACSLLAGIWIAPYYEVATTEDVKLRLALRAQVSLIIRTARNQQQSGVQLEELLRHILTDDPRSADANFRVCKSMVAELFEGVIDNTVLPDKPEQWLIMETLAIFAHASGKLFTVEQIVTLQTFTNDVNDPNDMRTLRAVMVVFRHVLPLHTTYPDNFLLTVRNALQKSLSKMGNRAINECAQCFSIIDGILKENGQRPLLNIISMLRDVRTKSLNEGNLSKRLALIGYLGKHCNIEHRINDVKKAFSDLEFKSVADLLVNVLLPFTLEKHPKGVRRQALESVAMMCQSFPREYARGDVNEAFKLVFANEDIGLKSSLLDQFLDVFAQEENRSGTGLKNALDKGAGKGAEGFINSLVANESDGVPNRLASNFLSHAIQIALTSTGDVALKATKFIASSNRQGLILPMDCLPALVALETSPNPTISDVAFQEHRNLWKKNNGMEKEYMKGVSLAFEHHRDILKDTKGVIIVVKEGKSSFNPKLRLCYDVLCSGEFKPRKKFLSNLVDRLNFQLSKLDTSGVEPRPLAYTRFCVENFALFDYARTEEVLHVISCLEKVVIATGSEVAQEIEPDILGNDLDTELIQQEETAPATTQDLSLEFDPSIPSVLPPAEETLSSKPSAKPINETRLRHLTVASTILTLMWETRKFLRHYWSLDRGKPGAKLTLKELNSRPTKATFSTPDKHLQRIAEIVSSLDDTDAMLARCKVFADLMSHDDEAKNKSDDDEDGPLDRAADGYDTPTGSGDEDNASNPPSGSGRGRKRKNSFPIAGTPRKRKTGGTGKPRGRQRKSRGGSGSTPDADDGWD
ncbi:uncharacterized protein BDZ99DRAFT_514855 [Mytilinidion resinicola]|uniref:Sister chromatid cohesion protein n=1 Tax=Mytilinidion resinicola TaxID=574789 RepID=A0A6A6Z615_9PEZI|nr:uncharacterized protein BDZ99DRAFT_514855 [Mytilinidion resinicola]KAF2816258.1 hypothetical protein BDZ99DRAFT_514855 [Mytilinidion resinicola]